MLYKHLFSIFCGHLNLNQKIIFFEFGRLPVKPTGKPVKPTGTLVRTVCTMDFEFKFDFDRFGPVSGQTGPVYRYRTPPVWPDGSLALTLVVARRCKLRNGDKSVTTLLHVHTHGSRCHVPYVYPCANRVLRKREEDRSFFKGPRKGSKVHWIGAS